MDALVSILIPAYNAGEWLAATIESALAQTWPRTEIVVVDDGSKDATLAVARSFEPRGVRVFTQTNQGAAATRNRLFELSRGEFIQWLDADDLLSPDKVARQMRAALASGDRRMLFSCAWGRFLYRAAAAKFAPNPLYQDLAPAEWLLRKLEHDTYLQTACWLVSRELTEAAGPWNTALLGDDDGEYFARVLLASRGVQFVAGAKVYYRAAPASLSHVGRSDRKMEAQWRSMELTIGYLRSLDDGPRGRAACVTYLQNWLVFFYPYRMDLVAAAQGAAAALGGRLHLPRPAWKYAWLRPLLGPGGVRRAQIALPAAKNAVRRRVDRTLWRLAGCPGVPRENSRLGAEAL